MRYRKQITFLFVLLMLIIKLFTPIMIDTLIRNVAYLHLVRGNIDDFSLLVNFQISNTKECSRSKLQAAVLEKDFSVAALSTGQSDEMMDEWFQIWLLNMAKKFYDSGDSANAAKVLDLINMNRNPSSEFYYLVGDLNRDLDQVQKAISSYTLGIYHSAPEDRIEGQCRVVQVYKDEEDWRKVIDIMDPIWNNPPENLFDKNDCRSAILDYAQALEMTGRERAARNVYQGIVEINSGKLSWQTHIAQLNLGDAYLVEESFSNALKSYIVAYNSALVVNYDSRFEYEARAAKRMEKLVRSIRDNIGTDMNILQEMSNFIAQDQNNPGALLYFAIHYEFSKEYDEAIKSYSRLLDLVPDSDYLENRLSDLESVFND